MDKLICDFCSDPNPVWDYPAKTFTLKDTPAQSIGNWAACSICHALIETRDYDGLADRCTSEFIRNNPTLGIPFDGMKADMLRLHQQFLDNRTGPALPL